MPAFPRATGPPRLAAAGCRATRCFGDQPRDIGSTKRPGSLGRWCAARASPLVVHCRAHRREAKLQVGSRAGLAAAQCRPGRSRHAAAGRLRALDAGGSKTWAVRPDPTAGAHRRWWTAPAGPGVTRTLRWVRVGQDIDSARRPRRAAARLGLIRRSALLAGPSATTSARAAYDGEARCGRLSCACSTA